MSKSLRVSIVGCGGIAQRHKMGYETDPDVQVVSVYDANESAARSFVDGSAIKAASSLKELIERDKPDAVSVCTPPGTHLENAAPLLQAGIAVLCEKPLERDAQAAAELAQVADRTGTMLMTGFCHRFHGPIIELKKLIDAGKLGDPVLLRVIFTGGMSMQGNHRADPKLSGGGCLIDNASHAVDLFCHLMGEPARITAMCGNAVQQLPIEDIGIMLLSTADGTQYGEITTSLSTAVGASRVEWFGTKGTATVSYWMPGEPELSYRCVKDEQPTTVDCEHHPMRFIGEIQHFIACVRDGVMPDITAADGLCVSKAIEAAYQSSRDGVQVTLS